MTAFGRSTLELARWSLTRTLRQPVMIVPVVFFPLMFFLVIAGGASRAADIPGFPAPSYLAFALPGAFVQGTMLGGVSSGTGLAIDVETGFLKRLALTPVHASSILIGHIAGALMVALIMLSTFLIAGLALQVDIAAGIPGILVMFALSLLVSLGFSGIGAILALRTGSAEKVQGVFPLFFVLLIFSTFMMPLELISSDWFRWVARVNPATYFMEGLRSLVVTGWDAAELAKGFAAAGGIALVSVSAAARVLRKKVQPG